MEKITNIFDRLNNTIGNHMEGKATDKDLIKMAYEVDKYLLENPHPHDLVKNNDLLHSVSYCYECKKPYKNKDREHGMCHKCWMPIIEK